MVHFMLASPLREERHVARIITIYHRFIEENRNIDGRSQGKVAVKRKC